MKISCKWLQSYFEEKLPSPEKLAELITFGFAEVEGMEKSPLEKGALPSSAGGLLQPPKAALFNNPPRQPPLLRGIKGDTIFDIKILPDRACYALSHRGVAYEVGAILGLKRKEFNWPQPSVAKVRKFEVRVEAPELCSRYMARVIENVTAKDLPWVKEHLEAIGQRSINPIVDGANIVMFDIGQPLHAFDADRVEGGIVVRRARKGEKIITLDNREVTLDESVLVIADENSPLAIAGIKGGKKAEVTAATRNLILESANFNPSHIRKTSEQLGIKTDASKRFENRLSPEWASVGINDFTEFLFEMDKNLKAGEIIDQYPEKQKEKKIIVTAEYIAKKLGIKISSKQIEDILSRLLITAEKMGNELLLTPPVFRMDLNIKEDIAEEVGRIISYGKIPSLVPPYQRGKGGCDEIPKQFYYEWKIREILVNAGFSEVMTSSFAEKGNVAIEKPLAEDKKYARSDLRGGFATALRMNFLNAPLLGSDEVRMFEIGKVFQANGESTALALGYVGQKKKGIAVLKETRELLEKTLTAHIVGEEKEGIFECNLDEAFDKLPEPQKWDISIPSAKAAKFQQFSQYPFIVRDVALFISPLEKVVVYSDVPGVVIPITKGGQGVVPSAEDVHTLILKDAGPLVVRSRLFDRFEKDGKLSFAFHLVFQSLDRTLTDAEVNGIMEKIYAEAKVKGWQVR